jgi:predicted AlkP superfamily phosphohydrolase/phosphomutase
MLRRKTLIIGLDGATFKVLTPLIEKKCLPNIQRIVENGSSGTLLSTIPPVTAPAWLALATGMRPEKTGAYDFLLRRDDAYHLRSLNSAYFQGRTIWDHLSQQGRTIGVFNYPLLRPPYPVNGIIVSGLGTVPGEEFTYPASLKDEFRKVLQTHYEIMLPLYESRYLDLNVLFDHIGVVLDKQTKVIEYLLSKNEWDLFWLVFSVTDWVQHRVWAHIDKTHPLYQGKKSDLIAQGFEAFWMNVDEAIGKFCAIVGPEANIMIISDHGFGPHNEVFKPNAWLEREGYLVRKKTSVLNQMRKSLSLVLQDLALKASRFKIIPSGFYKFGRQSMQKVKVDISDRIDLEKTIALEPGHTIPFGGIYINDQVVKDPSEREIIAGQIITKLKNWGTEHGMEIETWQPDFTLNNESRSSVPDIIVTINNWGCKMIKDSFDDPIWENRPFAEGITGTHRMEGIFICSGPDIRNIHLENAHIYDVAPTLFHLFGEAIPSYVDGRVLTEIFEPAYLMDHPVKMQDGASWKSGGQEEDYKQGEEEAIKKQLEDLGYM